MWFGLFEDIEAELQAEGKPVVSLSPRRTDIEAMMIDAWSTGDNPTLHSLVEKAGGL